MFRFRAFIHWARGLRPRLAWMACAAFFTLFDAAVGATEAPRLLLDAARGAPAGPQRVDALEIEWVADRQAVLPGESLWLAVRLKHDPGWHTYWQNPGDSGLPTTLEPRGPEGVRFGSLQWPIPMRLWVGPLANYGYEGEVLLPMRVTVPDALPKGMQALSLSAQASWLICKEVCIPGQAQLALSLPVRATTEAPIASAMAPRIEQALARVPNETRPMQARWVANGDQVALVIAEPTASGGGAAALPRAAEFFPAAAGWLSAPAPQRLIHQRDGWRLELAAAEGGSPPPAAGIEGAVLIDGRIAWLRATAMSGALEPGQVVSVAGRPATTAHPVAPDAMSLVAALALGMLGGLLLNLMPCVFPVVGLKIASLAGGDPRSAEGRSTLRSGLWAFVLGILVCFALLAGVMLGLRSAGAAIGWGFQLQSAAFVAAMALLFMAIGLNFSGVYEIGASLTRLGQLEIRDAGATPLRGSAHLASSFSSGVLAVLVATPCTAPFMGSAVGLTLSLPAWAALLVFLAVGLGMSLPYLVLGLWPQGLSRLPRPGRWMQTLKHALAFPMYSSASWLAWVLAQQSDADGVLRLLLATVFLGLAAWAWGERARATRALTRGVWLGLLCLALFAMLSLWAGIQEGRGLAATGTNAGATAPGMGSIASGTGAGAPSASDRLGPRDPLASSREPLASPREPSWSPWSEAAVQEALASDRPVFVDFTAAWCVSCQANKRWVLDSTAVRDAFARDRVVLLRADWTRQDPAITAELARHGRNGVPLYLVYWPGRSAPQVLPELLTARMVTDALRP